MGLKRVVFRAEVTSPDPDDTPEDVVSRVRDQLAHDLEGMDLVLFTVLSADEEKR